MEIKTAVTETAIASCRDAITVLRPELAETDFIPLVKQMQQEGYTLIYITDKEKTVAAAGYRIMTMLYCGKIVYIDDLVTLSQYRGKGYAGKLLDFIEKVAQEGNCKGIHLDSGFARKDAHRLYLNRNFTISALHFAKTQA